MTRHRSPDQALPHSAIKNAEEAARVAAGDGKVAIGRGLARVRRQKRLSADDVVLAVSGHICGSLRLDRERLTSLRLLGEYYGLWGAGRKAPPTGDEPSEKPGLRVRDAEA